MNQPILGKKRNLNCKTPITVLTLISLLCRVLTCTTYFAFYRNNELTFAFPSFLNLIVLVLTLAPNILLILYVLKFFKEFRATIIVPIIFACIAAAPLFSFINNLVSGYGLNLIINLITIITFTLATISALKGLYNKVFIIIPTAFNLALSVISLFRAFSTFRFYVMWDYTLYLFAHPAGIIASITLNVALLLFGLNNRIPAILAVSPEKEKKNAANMSPEQSLRLLKDKLDFGMITEEEYQAQRAEIISKL